MPSDLSGRHARPTSTPTMVRFTHPTNITLGTTFRRTSARCGRDAAIAGKQRLPAVDALERGEDVLDVVAGDAVKMKIGGVQLGRQFGPFGFVPLVEPAAVFLPKAAGGEVAGVGKRQHVFGLQVSFSTRWLIHDSSVVRRSHGHGLS